MQLVDSGDVRVIADGRIGGILCFLALILVMSWGSGEAHGQVSWVGGVGSYTDGANWSGGAVPEGDDDIVITNGGTAQASGNIPILGVSIGGGSTLDV
ncbi:MAG: hypothetical protein WEB60_01235, partial [Terrimicrobiaceae bacterium]